ncbi:DUF3159 domain-containing protein [Nocardia lijiangensis]|uniref:DUF3159 domain-containing protein n=1 Tax=Nocardia lijiangensis TaxID=299618 RepID=UPI000833CC5E|nr:DUF3159 domain-containing protein [Nocardia lijiangensis]
MTFEDSRSGTPHDSAQVRSSARVLGQAVIARGGVRHLVDAATPVAVFLIGYQLFGTGPAVAATVTAAALLAGWRLRRGDSPKVVTAALVAVTAYSALVLFTGEGRAFFLPEILGCAVLTVAFGATLLRGRPLSLLVCQRLRIEPADADRSRIRKHRRLTAAWAVMWALHVLILLPLYAADQIAALAVATTLLGKPSVLIAVAASWVWVRKG